MVIFVRIALAAIIVTAATSAQSDIFSDTAAKCQSAIDLGDRDSFNHHANDILEWRSVFNTQAILAAKACLTEGFGKEWEYHPPTSRFVESSTLLDEKAAIAARTDARKAADASASENRMEMEAARIKRERDNRQQVRNAVYDACTQLLDDNRVAALTNALCVDSFLLNGLPGE